MPEYLAPGVYVEETAFRSRPVEGVSTSTAAFVGPTSIGPAGSASDVLASVTDYERNYGAGSELVFADGSRIQDFMWHSVRGFFANGGRKLHVGRVWRKDGLPPEAADYAAALELLEPLTGVAIVAAPGSTAGYQQVQTPDVRARIRQRLLALLAHVDRVRYRMAILDSGDGQTALDIRQMRASLDSPRGAIYYPWIRVADSKAGGNVVLPPSGFVAGIYARVDDARGVHKAPANEVVALATGLERDIPKAETDVLNPLGINCLQNIPGRGVRVWGSRTLSSDPELKWISLRRLLMFLEQSVERSTQWVAFEPNAEPLWREFRRAVEDFLLAQWKAGALLGSTADEAFFVRCGRTTMSQSDLDSGRLVCLIGVAPLRPAEFVTFRIGQWTADRES